MSDGFGRIALATRLAGPCPAPFLTSFVMLAVQGMRPGDALLEPVSRAPAHKAANLLAEAFMESGADTLCFVDSDHVFTADTLTRLRDNPTSWPYDACGALYRVRGNGAALLLRETPEGQTAPEDGPGLRWLWPDRLDTWPPGAVIEVDALGLGFTLIRRRVFEGLTAPWFFYPRWQDDATEDAPFFKRAQAAGFRFCVDTGVCVGHLRDDVQWAMPPEYLEAAKAAREERVRA